MVKKLHIEESTGVWKETPYSLFINNEKVNSVKYTKEYSDYRIMILPDYNRKTDTLSYIVFLFIDDEEPRKLEVFETPYDAKDFADYEVYDMYIKSINESNKFNRNRSKLESANDIVNNLVSLTKGMWFKPMNKFKSIVYNADEIIPKIDFNSCVEFGTNNGQELIIYDKQDGRKHIRYSCSMTTMFDELVITDVWDKSGCVYKCDWDVIFDELAKKNNYNINEDLDTGNIRALAYSTADEIVKVLRKYNIQIENTEYKKLKDKLDNTIYKYRFNVLIYTRENNNDYRLVIDLALDPQSVWITTDYRITFNAFGSNPSKKEFESIQKAVDEIQDIKSQYDRVKEKITNQFD